ncbi:MAG: alpha/beta hydrolase [Planctomycetes bacterium]|nr:alpha/beta hydrolase [Planctomycetota bacterium]
MSDENPRFSLPDGVALDSNVTYGQGGGRDLKCDLYLPTGEGAGRPGIVFIHGGGWRGGTRNQFREQAAHMATLGFVGLCIEYRYSGEAKFPAAVEDVKCAVRWLRAHAESYGIDSRKIASVGGSAGAHLAAMLGTTDASAGLEGEGGYPDQSSKVNAMVPFNGVFDMAACVPKSPGAESAIVEFIGGPPDDMPEAYRLASPISHVDATTAPTLLLHGNADEVVPFEQSLMFKRALEKAGVHVELYEASDAGHGFFNRPPFFTPTLKRLELFLLKTFE